MFEFMSHLSNGKCLSREIQKATESDPYEHYLSGFWRLEQSDIRAVEFELGYEFPPQLFAFYSEIGVGTVRASGKAEGLSYNNVIFPWDIGKLLSGDCVWMDPETGVQPGTLPFFERDIGLFLCLHPGSDEPNAVYWMWGEKICDSLVEFFQRLLVDPDWFNPSTDGVSSH